MQFSIENNNLENVLQGLFQKRLSSPICQRKRIRDYDNTRSWQSRLSLPRGRTNTVMASRITNSPFTSPLSASPLIGIGQDDLPTLSTEELNAEVVENGNGISVEEMIESMFNKKERIQNKTDFCNVINSVGAEKFKELFKAYGEKYFDNKESQRECEKVNEQLATPMPTPIENVYLDENELQMTFGNKENDNSLVVPHTPASIDFSNIALPTIDSTPMNQVIPSPEIFSPIQPNLNSLDLLGAGKIITELPELQPTPYEKPLDFMASTPILDQPLQQEPKIIVQDELNPFKSPAPIVEPISQLLAPSPTISSPLNGLLGSTQIQSPALSLIQDSSISQPSVDSTVEDLLRSLSASNPSSSISNLIQNSPFIGSADSSLLLNPSSAIQNSPIQFPVDSTPALPTEPLNVNFDEISSILNGNNLLSANPTLGKEEENEVLMTNEEKNSDLGNDCNLVEVDELMKTIKDLLKKKEEGNEGNEGHAHNDCGCSSFPSEEMIKNFMVSELEFEFSNENITKLVHMAPIEVVQEDVVELEKLAKQKRGKGRPRKPRKYSICPFTGCGKKFNREFNLKEHIRIHNPRRNKEFICSQCNESFYSSSVLSRHIASIHQGEKFYCKNCGKKFNRKDALHRHEKISCHFSN